MCKLHYQRALRAGGLDNAPRSKRTQAAACQIPGCDRRPIARDLCMGHYSRYRDGRALDTPMRPRRRPDAPCSVGGCDRRDEVLGMCKAHYGRGMQGRSLKAPLRQRIPGGASCSVDWCDRRATNAGMCVEHKRRAALGRDMDTPFQRKGGAGSISRGYRVLRTNGRRILEHRHIMEQRLGRPLRPEESVHHLNGVRDDNRPENLELWSKSHPSGQRVVDKLAWAREIVALYGQEIH